MVLFISFSLFVHFFAEVFILIPWCLTLKLLNMFFIVLMNFPIRTGMVNCYLRVNDYNLL